MSSSLASMAGSPILSPSETSVFKGTVSIQSSAASDKLSSKRSVVSTWVNPIALADARSATGFFLNGHIVVKRTPAFSFRQRDQHSSRQVHYLRSTRTRRKPTKLCFDAASGQRLTLPNCAAANKKEYPASPRKVDQSGPWKQPLEMLHRDSSCS